MIFRRTASLVNASDNMERNLIEQATQLNTIEESHGNNDAIKNLWKSRVMPMIIDRQETISDHIARLESLKDSVCERFVHMSAGYGLRWHEIESVRESYIDRHSDKF